MRNCSISKIRAEKQILFSSVFNSYYIDISGCMYLNNIPITNQVKKKFLQLSESWLRILKKCSKAVVVLFRQNFIDEHHY